MPQPAGRDVPVAPAGRARPVLAWVDGLQRRHGVLGFPFAVLKKYGDDRGGRQAALITYYGFLSIFPILLVAASVLSTVLASRPVLRQQMVEAVLPAALRDTVNAALAALPSSGLPFVLGLVGLVLSGTGVTVSAYESLNHLAGVPLRSRFGWLTRYARVTLMVVVVLAGGISVAALTVAAGALPDVGQLQRLAASLATVAVVFVVLIVAARVLVARPVRWRTGWLPALLGACCVALVLSVGARLLAVLVAKAGPVYGSFATVAGIFALLYLTAQTLLIAAEVALVRHGQLWPRAVLPTRPTSADTRALTRLATIQERLPSERIQVRFDPTDPTDPDRHR